MFVSLTSIVNWNNTQFTHNRINPTLSSVNEGTCFQCTIALSVFPWILVLFFVSFDLSDLLVGFCFNFCFGVLVSPFICPFCFEAVTSVLCFHFVLSIVWIWSVNVDTDFAGSGGAIAFSQSEGTFSHCTFEDNSAKMNQSSGALGLWLSLFQMFAKLCGWIAFWCELSDFWLRADFCLQYCLFACLLTLSRIANLNFAWFLLALGGAIFTSSSTLSLSSDSILQNNADQGGAVAITDHSVLAMSNCEVIQNMARVSGGGLFTSRFVFLFAFGIDFIQSSIPCITFWQLIHPQAILDFSLLPSSRFQKFALVRVTSANRIQISDSSINNNTAQVHAGAIYCEQSALLTFSHCALTNNQALTGLLPFVLRFSGFESYWRKLIVFCQRFSEHFQLTVLHFLSNKRGHSFCFCLKIGNGGAMFLQQCALSFTLSESSAGATQVMSQTLFGNKAANGGGMQIDFWFVLAKQKLFVLFKFESNWFWLFTSTSFKMNLLCTCEMVDLAGAR